MRRAKGFKGNCILTLGGGEGLMNKNKRRRGTGGEGSGGGVLSTGRDLGGGATLATRIKICL